MHPVYNYAAVLAASQKIAWKIDDIVGGDRRLDFSRPFMPEALARTRALDFLDRIEQRTLNQIRGHAYLGIFGMVEEFILPFVVDHARPLLRGDDHRARALLGFASDEAKHIHLFKTFRAEFQRDFGTDCAVIGTTGAIAKAVLAHHPLGVALAVLHIEWMTQRHYLDSIETDLELEPRFKSLLRHHWMDEAQHARLDTIMVDSIAVGLTPSEIATGVGDYLKIVMLIDDELAQQAAFDLDALARATGRTLTPHEHERATLAQIQANRWTYLGSGMTHPDFLATLGAISPAGRAQVEAVAPAFR